MSHTVTLAPFLKLWKYLMSWIGENMVRMNSHKIVLARSKSQGGKPTWWLVRACLAGACIRNMAREREEQARGESCLFSRARLSPSRTASPFLFTRAPVARCLGS